MQKRRKLPPLNALKAFESAARLGGFTAASEELFVSPGAISRHVANLEGFLGQSLFKRGRNEVQLTAAGSSYLSKVQDALDAIEDASSPTSPGAGSQKLHISSLPTITDRWLIPRLPSFLQAHPEASIQISTSMEETDWDTDRVDVSIYASLDGLIERGQPLFETRISPVCSPAWLRQFASPPSAYDLMSTVLLTSSSRRGDWLRWLHAAGVQADGVLPQLSFGTSALAYRAAIEGLGAVCAEREMIVADLAAGRLVELSEVSIAGSIYFVDVKPGKRQSTLAQDFTRWLLSQSSPTA